VFLVLVIAMLGFGVNRIMKLEEEKKKKKEKPARGSKKGKE
jgi:Na+-transporting methylmalonyl-CoA/oxaloacetate decarboxylase gamma subunit